MPGQKLKRTANRLLSAPEACRSGLFLLFFLGKGRFTPSSIWRRIATAILLTDVSTHPKDLGVKKDGAVIEHRSCNIKSWSSVAATFLKDSPTRLNGITLNGFTSILVSISNNYWRNRKHDELLEISTLLSLSLNFILSATGPVLKFSSERDPGPLT
jgi:hypothetical protein